MRRLRRGDEIIEKIIFKEEWEEMCPIFIGENNNYEHIGTGVLLNIWDTTYLLTAAHVIDFIYEKNKELYIPNNEGKFIKIFGKLFHNPLTYNQKREEDKIDFSYYELEQNMVVNISQMFKPLEEKQISFEKSFLSNVPQQYINNIEKIRFSNIKNIIKENLTKIDTSEWKKYNDILIENRITFAGYPLTKTKRHNGITRGERVYYHGGAVHHEIYTNEQFDKNINILAKFGRVGSYKEDVGFNNHPKPFGISGGGIYRIIRTDDGFDRKLIGIGHTYLKNKHIFIGTNIHHCLEIIKNQKLMPYEVYKRLNAMTEALNLSSKNNK